MKDFDVIIIGGSYAGLSAAMALGRARKKVLIIDSGLPCNRQTPYSHNFLTRDGVPPQEISAIALSQVLQYPAITLLKDLAVKGVKTPGAFDIHTVSGGVFSASRLIFATGIRDLMPPIEGLAECWGISVIHCPFCHGYEVRDTKTGILANGEAGFEMAQLISGWTNELTLYTNGPSTLTADQHTILQRHHIHIDEKEIARLDHNNGKLRQVVFKDGAVSALEALYAKLPFEQHCNIPEDLGCELTEAGYLKISATYETTVKGIYACGDNAGGMRSVANAVGMGNAAGAIISKQLIFDNF